MIGLRHRTIIDVRSWHKLCYPTARNYNLHRKSSSSKGKNIRIGCASGFWGDTATSTKQLVKLGKLDFLVFDYLSEITMSLLTVAKRKNPEFGYAPDFVHQVMGPNFKDIMQQSIKVISNSGGVNPLGCANELRKVAEKQGN